MPTKRIADKSAALEAIKQLHQVCELNEHLLPISKMVDLSDDEDTKQERSRHEGTAKRSNNYPNKVQDLHYHNYNCNKCCDLIGHSEARGCSIPSKGK